MDYIKHIIQELEGNISKENALALQVWKDESEENQKLYSDYIDIWKKTGDLTLDFAIEKQEAKVFLKNEIRQTTIQKVQYWKWAIAASILLIAGNFGWNYLNSNFSSAETMAHVLSTTSEAKTFVLPDQSEVILGPNSSLTYQSGFNDSDRKLNLEGSLFADVTKNKDLPFVVQTDGFDVKVLGTAFQISSINEDKIAKVSVLRGLVEVSTKNMKVELHPDEAVLVDVSSNLIKQTPYSVKDIAQFTKPLIFKDTPLSEVATSLEKRFHVSIKLEYSSSSSKCNFTGKFFRQDLNSIMKIIQEATNLKLRKQSNSSYVWIVIPC